MEEVKHEKQRKGGKENQREGMVDVFRFIFVFLGNSFRLCAWLIALLLAHEHTLYMHIHSRRHVHTFILLALHGNRHGNKMYRTQSGGIFLSLKCMETTIGTTKGVRDELERDRARVTPI